MVLEKWRRKRSRCWGFIAGSFGDAHVSGDPCLRDVILDRRWRRKWRGLGDSPVFYVEWRKCPSPVPKARRSGDTVTRSRCLFVISSANFNYTPFQGQKLNTCARVARVNLCLTIHVVLGTKTCGALLRKNHVGPAIRLCLQCGPDLTRERVLGSWFWVGSLGVIISESRINLGGYKWSLLFQLRKHRWTTIYRVRRSKHKPCIRKWLNDVGWNSEASKSPWYLK